jgi:hypothetical protein
MKIKKRINAGVQCPRRDGRGYTEGTRARACAKLHPCQRPLPRIDVPPRSPMADAVSETLERWFRAVLDPGPRMVVEVDPGSDKLTMTMKAPLEWFIGRHAGELRASGMKIEANVPDCAVVRRNAQSGIACFEWIELDFTLTPTGAAP